MVRLVLFQECKDASILRNRSLWYTTFFKKDKNHKINRYRKSTGINDHLFMLKTPSKLVLEGTYLNSQQPNIHNKPTANCMFSGLNLKTFSLKSGTIQWCLLSLFLLNTVSEILATTIRHEYRYKWHPSRRGRSKALTLPRWLDTLYRKP